MQPIITISNFTTPHFNRKPYQLRVSDSECICVYRNGYMKPFSIIYVYGFDKEETDFRNFPIKKKREVSINAHWTKSKNWIMGEVREFDFMMGNMQKYSTYSCI